MAKYRVKNPKHRPVDSRDRLPAERENVLLFVKLAGWIPVIGHDVRNLHRFSSGPIYWCPMVSL